MISVDKTLPTIAFTGNHGVYGVLETVDGPAPWPATVCPAYSPRCIVRTLSRASLPVCASSTAPFSPQRRSDFASNVAVASTSFQIPSDLRGFVLADAAEFLESAAADFRRRRIHSEILCGAQLRK
jgi:hypothetical protein